jgi:hypothetical protein
LRSIEYSSVAHRVGARDGFGTGACLLSCFDFPIRNILHYYHTASCRNTHL